jgi:hypothetical protein
VSTRYTQFDVQGSRPNPRLWRIRPIPSREDTLVGNPGVLSAGVTGRGFCPCGEVLTRRHQFLAGLCVGLYGRTHEIAPESYGPGLSTKSAFGCR